jgi:hypothetical protein
LSHKYKLPEKHQKIETISDSDDDCNEKMHVDNSVEKANSLSPKRPQELRINEASGDRSVKRRKLESTVARKSATCDVCGKTFTRHDRMMRHKGIAHPNHESDAFVEHAPPASPTWPREQEALPAAETDITAQTFVCDVLYLL